MWGEERLGGQEPVSLAWGRCGPVSSTSRGLVALSVRTSNPGWRGCAIPACSWLTGGRTPCLLGIPEAMKVSGCGAQAAGGEPGVRCF